MPMNVSMFRLLCARRVWAGSCASLPVAGDRWAKAHAEDAMDVDEQAKSAQADLSPVQASVIPHGHGSVCSLVKPAKVVASTTPTLSVVAPQKRNTAHGQFAYATWAGCGEHPRDALDLANNLHQWLCQRRCDHHSEPSSPRRWSGLPHFAPALFSRIHELTMRNQINGFPNANDTWIQRSFPFSL